MVLRLAAKWQKRRKLAASRAVQILFLPNFDGSDAHRNLLDECTHSLPQQLEADALVQISYCCDVLTLWASHCFPLSQSGCQLENRFVLRKRRGSSFSLRVRARQKHECIGVGISKLRKRALLANPKVSRTGPGIHSALGVGDRHIDREHRGDKEPRYASRRHLGECKWHRHVMSDLRRDISVCEIALRHRSACAVQKKNT